MLSDKQKFFNYFTSGEEEGEEEEERIVSPSKPPKVAKILSPKPECPMSPDSVESPVKAEIKEPKIGVISPKCEPKDESDKTEVIETGNEVEPDGDADEKEEKKDNDVAENSKAEVRILPVKR